MQQDAAKGDAKAQDWIRRAVSAAGLICALFCALMLPACDSPKTVVPVHGPIPPVADYSDDGRQDGGIWQFNADGSQVVTQGVKDNYARLLKKFLPSQDAARGFTAAGNAPNGCPLWHMDADICGLYGDLCGDERDRITPTN